MMGCTSEQRDCYDNEKPAHTVTVSDFYIAKYEVTQNLWVQVMGNNPSYFQDCGDCPVEQVSWDDVQEFLRKLNAQKPGSNYRLPTEAEWEYAARSRGTSILFGNGKIKADPNEVNFDGNWNPKSYSVKGLDRRKTVPVGSLNSPNTLGLHDMSGNVWEWCSDWYKAYDPNSQHYATDQGANRFRIQRGGAWGRDSRFCRVAYRSYDLSTYRGSEVGFRLARTP